MKINLSNVVGGFNLQKINDNFAKIADTINNKVLFRDNPAGEPNALLSDVDANSKTIYNVGTLSTSKLSVGGKDVTETVTSTADAKVYADQSKASAEASAASAVESSGFANASATSAAASNASRVLSETARSESVTAKNASVAAWAAAATPVEQLAAITQSSHVGNVVKTLIIDTSKDSDGGLWRERCQGLSWMTETLATGKWLQQRTSAATAWAVSGAVTGDFFQNSTDGKFYTLGASSPAVTEVFRGNKNEFPALAGVVEEANRVVIYDLTQPGCPMWRSLTHRGISTLASLTSCGYSQQRLFLGSGSSFGLTTYDFVKDEVVVHQAGGRSTVRNLAAACQSAAMSAVVDTSTLIVNSNINDIATTVLADAPQDPATGLLVPTIAVACGSGNSGNVGSVISHSGAVVNYAQASVDGTQVSFLPNGDVAWGTSGSSVVYVMPLATSNVASLSASGARIYGVGTIPGFSSGPFNRKTISAGAILACYGTQAGNGIHLVKENLSASSLGMVSNVTTTQPHAWQVGDSRGAWLIDTVAETLSAPELVANGVNPVSTTGWSAINATLSAAGTLVATSTVSGGNAVQVYEDFSTVVGKTYSIGATLVGASGVTSPAYLLLAQDTSFTTIKSQALTTSTSFNFVATATTTRINVRCDGQFTVGATVSWNSLTCKQVDPDRSVKANGLNIIGTLTKAPVATGSQLVAYSGFSASNYLEQATSSNFDFGTGDFSMLVVGTWNSPSGFQTLIGKYATTAGSLGEWKFEWGGDAKLGFSIHNGTSWTRVGSTGQTPTGVGDKVAIYVRRLAGTTSIFANGVLLASAAFHAGLTVTNSAPLRVGLGGDGTGPMAGSLSLVRISGTALSDDQIAQIYRDELAMFQTGAQCTMAGSSNAVTALGYDSVTDVTHALTSYGRSSFKGLIRVASEATTVGTPSSISVEDGAISFAGSTGAKIDMPAIGFREDRKRRAEVVARVNDMPQMLPFTAIAAQVDFVLKKGFVPRAVYSAGLLRVLNTDYTIRDDGYQKTVRFATAPGAGVIVNIFSVRG